MKSQTRNTSGSSLVELTVGTLVMSFIAAGIMGLCYLNWKTAQRIDNKTDGVTAAMSAIDHISHEVRQARNVGDYYGAVFPPTQRIVDPFTEDVTTDVQLVHSDALDQGALEAGTASLASPMFPAPGDPQYDSSSAVVSGWQNSVVSPQVPYTLSGRCLVVQEPIFTPDGFPQAYRPAGVPTVLECLDTWVYQVLPDSRADHPGEWTLQVVGYPGFGSNMANPRRPKTLVTGIIGPLDRNGNPEIFQYLTNADSAPTSTVNWSNVSDVSGVIVNLEIRKQEASASAIQRGGQQALLAFKQEIYLRNNTLTTISATPVN